MSIKVLTVEDSALIRTIINQTIEEMDGIELIGTAENGKVALEQIRLLKPDIITLDMVMPVMDGIETLKALRKFSEIPVIVLSARNDKTTTFQALEQGAQDFLTKPESITKNKETFKEQLEMRIKALVYHEEAEEFALKKPRRKNRSRVNENYDAIVIGASTGGPKVLTSIIKELPKSLSIPVFIVQHMPKGFTASFAERLNSLAEVPVVEAKESMPIVDGTVYVAPGGYHMVVQDRRIRLLDTDKIHGVKPAVDPLFESAVNIFGQKTLGILLTGMGRDGAEGCLKIKQSGGHVLVQDEKTCVVYGMPRHAVDLGAVDEILPIEEIIKKIKEIVTEEHDE